MSTAELGFSTTVARDIGTLRQACAVRALAYGHHLGDAPGLARALAEPDATDRAAGTWVLVCRDKASGQVVGTARLQRNHPHALPIETCIELPAGMAGSTRAEITRLAILPGADPLVRPMLVKACWMLAIAAQVRHLVIGARSAALVRIYRGLGFTDLLADAEGRSQTVPLLHAGGLPHHVLAFDVVAAERRWHAAQHALYGFMVQTWHPDLDLVGEPAQALARPAAALRRPALWRAAARPRHEAGRHRQALAPAAAPGADPADRATGARPGRRPAAPAPAAPA